jgi:hypothetical protein
LLTVTVRPTARPAKCALVFDLPPMVNRRHAACSIFGGVNYFTFSWPVVLIGVAVVVVVGLLVAWGVGALERRNRQESRAESIQTAVTHALVAEPVLGGASILPVARIPVDGPPTLELTGTVPSQDARGRAVGIAERELARVRPGMQVIDRLEVVPSLAQRRGA